MNLARDLNPHDSNSLFFFFKSAVFWDFLGFSGIFSDFLGFSGIHYEIQCHLRCSPLATVPRHHHQATEPRLCQRGPRRSQLQPFQCRTAVPAPQLPLCFGWAASGRRQSAGRYASVLSRIVCCKIMLPKAGSS